MTRSWVVSRRALAAAVFTVGALAAAAGCSAGQLTQTDQTVPSVPGVNLQTPVPGGQLAIRNAYVVYPGTSGYPAGGNAVLSMRLFNDSPNPVRLTGAQSDAGTVRVGAPPAATPPAAAPPPSATPAATGSARPTGTASAQPTETAAATPSEPPAATPPAAAPPPSAITIPPRGVLVLDERSAQRLTIALRGALKPGDNVTVTLAFDNNVTLSNVVVPMDVPMVPASRVPLVTDEAGHGGEPES